MKNLKNLIVDNDNLNHYLRHFALLFVVLYGAVLFYNLKIGDSAKQVSANHFIYNDFPDENMDFLNKKLDNEMSHKSNFRKEQNNLFISNDIKGILKQNIPSSIKTLQIFSHAKQGKLLINGQWLNGEKLIKFIKTIKSDEVEHINIYGCNFASGQNGYKLISDMEKKLGVSIAASNNITGSNGDWILEVGKEFDVVTLPYFEGNL